MAKPLVPGKDIAKQVLAFRERVTENKSCFICDASSPEFVCLDFATFVCQCCSDLHCEYGHKVKSINHTEWNQEECDEMKKGGNRRGSKKWLASWDINIFARPSPNEEDRIRDFIRKAFVIKCWLRQPKKPLKAITATQPAAVLEPASSVQAPDQSGAGNAESSGAVGADAAQQDAGSDAAAQGMVLLDKNQAWFCSAHDSSEKRTKVEASFKPCGLCGTLLHTNYSEFSFCPGCSSAKSLCMICGAAQTSSSHHEQDEFVGIFAGKIGGDSAGTNTPTTACGDAESTSDVGSNAPSAEGQTANIVPSDLVNLLDVDLLDFDACPAQDNSASQNYPSAFVPSAACQSMDAGIVEFDAGSALLNLDSQSSPASVPLAIEHDSLMANLDSLFTSSASSLSTTAADTQQGALTVLGVDASRAETCNISTASSIAVTPEQAYKPWRPSKKQHTQVDHTAKQSESVHNFAISPMSKSPLDVTASPADMQAMVSDLASQRIVEPPKRHPAVCMPPPEAMESVSENSYSMAPDFGDLIFAMEEKSTVTSTMSKSPLDVTASPADMQAMVAELASQRIVEPPKRHSALCMPPPEAMEPVSENSYSMAPDFGHLILAMEEKSTGWEKR